MPNRVIAIFRQWDELLPGGLQGVDPKTVRRWLNQNDPPSVEAAKVVAAAAWGQIHSSLDKEAQSADGTAHRQTLLALRRHIFKAVRDTCADAPRDDWPDEVAFVAFFRRLAELERLPPFTLEADVLVAPSGTVDLVASRSVLHQNATPVRVGQSARIRLRASRPACLYVLWVQPGGLVVPVYPWSGAAAKADGSTAESAQTELLLPTPTTAWPFETRRGVETLVAFARMEPIGAKTLRTLASGGNKKLAEIHDSAPGPFSDDLAALKEKMEPAMLKIDFTKTIPLIDSTSAIRHRHATLAAWLGPYLEAGSCVSFLNAGEA